MNHVHRRTVLTGIAVATLATGLPPKFRASPRQQARDVRLPGQLYAVVASPPIFGYRLSRLDAEKASTIKDVVQIFTLNSELVPGGVVVVANNTWSALQGRDALDLTWEAPAMFPPPITGRFALAEAPTATAWMKDGQCRIWTSTEAMDTGPIANAIGMPAHKIILTSTYGNNGPSHYTIETALIALQTNGRPVQRVWTSTDAILMRHTMESSHIG